MADPIKILSLCSGVGMLDLGICAGLEYLGFAPRHVGYCERDAYAAACLLARMEDSTLEPAPIFCGDMRDMDAQPMRGHVDFVCAGLPCQPYSTAGKQRGLDDHRSYGDGDGPIPHFLRIVAECRPSLVFCENVPPWVRGGWFRPVGEELSRMGYTVESPLFVTAESVGASHRRERVFVLAVASGRGLRKLRESPERDGLADGGDGVVGQSASRGGDRIDEPLLGGQAKAWATPNATDGESAGGRQQASLTNYVTGRYSPQAPAKIGRVSPRTSRRRLNPAFVCWLMGCPWWWTRAEPISFGAAEMAAFRSKLRSHLSNLCGRLFE